MNQGAGAVLPPPTLPDDTHAAATTAVRGLQDDGEAALLGKGVSGLRRCQGLVGARHYWHPALRRRRPGLRPARMPKSGPLMRINVYAIQCLQKPN